MDVKEKIHLQVVHESGSVKIAAIIRQTIRCGSGDRGACVFGRKSPVAMVVVAGSRCHVTPLENEATRLLESKSVRAEIDAFAVTGIDD